MPELPEVETIVRELRERILNCPIAGARLCRPDLLKTGRVKRKDFARFLEGRTFQEITRRGKYLIFTLDNGGTLLAHLGMTGKFVVAGQRAPQPPHLCSQFLFADGHRLDHIDLRRFGRLEIYAPHAEIERLASLGPDPLSAHFGADALKPVIHARNGRRRRRAMHTLLLDQNLISGVGNIYASEALFRASIRPQRSAERVKTNELEPLARALKQVMRDAIAAGGTTVSDYRRVDDKPGNFVAFLNVYDREGEACRRCGQAIKRIRLGGRSAFFCPTCQK